MDPEEDDALEDKILQMIQEIDSNEVEEEEGELGMEKTENNEVQEEAGEEEMEDQKNMGKDAGDLPTHRIRMKRSNTSYFRALGDSPSKLRKGILKNAGRSPRKSPCKSPKKSLNKSAKKGEKDRHPASDAVELEEGRKKNGEEKKKKKHQSLEEDANLTQEATKRGTAEKDRKKSTTVEPAPVTPPEKKRPERDSDCEGKKPRNTVDSTANEPPVKRKKVTEEWTEDRQPDPLDTLDSGW